MEGWPAAAAAGATSVQGLQKWPVGSMCQEVRHFSGQGTSRRVLRRQHRALWLPLAASASHALLRKKGGALGFWTVLHGAEEPGLFCQQLSETP